MTPTTVEIVHALYADTAAIDLDLVLPGSIHMLVAQSTGDAPCDVRSTLSSLFSPEERIKVPKSHCGRGKQVVEDVIKSQNGVLLVKDEQEKCDRRLDELAGTVWHARPTADLLTRICDALWPRAQSIRSNRGIKARTLTDILVAARGATSAKSFYKRAASGPIIVFIDEIDSIAGAGAILGGTIGLAP